MRQHFLPIAAALILGLPLAAAVAEEPTDQSFQRMAEATVESLQAANLVRTEFTLPVENDDVRLIEFARGRQLEILVRHFFRSEPPVNGLANG